jgi:hypothetical protein
VESESEESESELEDTVAAEDTVDDSDSTEHAKEDTVDELCSDLLMRMPDDMFLRMLSMVSLNHLVSLRILSKAIKSRIDELCLQIPGLGARLFPYVRSTHGYLELPREKLVSLLRHPALASSTGEVLESAMKWEDHNHSAVARGQPRRSWFATLRPQTSRFV